VVAQLLLQFQFFDLLLDSVVFPSNPARPNYPKVPLQVPLPTNLKTVQSSIPTTPCSSTNILPACGIAQGLVDTNKCNRGVT
jgi:hypothetical protein